MRSALVVSAVLVALVAAIPASAQQARRQGGLVIDVKPRSWLDAGTSVTPGQGMATRTVQDTWTFGGGPVHGISSRYEGNLPERGYGRPLLTFDFLGANVNR